MPSRCISGRHAKPSSSCAQPLFVMHRHISRDPNTPASSCRLREKRAAVPPTPRCGKAHGQLSDAASCPDRYASNQDTSPPPHRSPCSRLPVPWQQRVVDLNASRLRLQPLQLSRPDNHTQTAPTTPPACSRLLRNPKSSNCARPPTRKPPAAKRTRTIPTTTLKTPADIPSVASLGYSGNNTPHHAPKEAANCRHRQPLLRGCGPRPPLRRPAVPSAAVVISPPFKTKPTTTLGTQDPGLTAHTRNASGGRRYASNAASGVDSCCFPRLGFPPRPPFPRRPLPKRKSTGGETHPGYAAASQGGNSTALVFL